MNKEKIEPGIAEPGRNGWAIHGRLLEPLKDKYQITAVLDKDFRVAMSEIEGKKRVPENEQRHTPRQSTSQSKAKPLRKSFVCNRFTLLELMIVISIITILMCLLLPSLSMSRQKGKEIACRGNLKQIGFAAANYSLDYNEWCISGQPSASMGKLWGSFMSDFNYLTAQTLKCPSENIFNIPSSYNYGLNWLTFGMHVTHGTARPQKIQNVSRFGRDSSVIYFADVPPAYYATIGTGFAGSDGLCYKSVYPINSGGLWYPVYARHNLRVNAAIFDGHVEGLTYKELINHPSAHWNPTQLSPGLLGMRVF